MDYTPQQMEVMELSTGLNSSTDDTEFWACGPCSIKVVVMAKYMKNVRRSEGEQEES